MREFILNRFDQLIIWGSGIEVKEMAIGGEMRWSNQARPLLYVRENSSWKRLKFQILQNLSKYSLIKSYFGSGFIYLSTQRVKKQGKTCKWYAEKGMVWQDRKYFAFQFCQNFTTNNLFLNDWKVAHAFGHCLIFIVKYINVGSLAH